MTAGHDHAHDAPVTAGEAIAPSERPQLTPRVLLVDAEQASCDYVTRILADRHEVTVAHDVRAAIEAARESSPALVLIDATLAEGMAEASRGEPCMAGVPVIVLTTREDERSASSATEPLADDYLAKPFDEGELLARMRVLLRARAQERELATLNRRLEAIRPAQ